MKKYIGIFLVIVSFFTTGQLLAHSYQQGDIRIGHIWARATPEGAKAAAVYVPLLNTGKEADRFIGASTPVADKAQIHDSTNEDGIMKMHAIDGIDLIPGKPVALHPGGQHIMLIGLKQQLNAGDKFPMTLQFEKAGSINVDVMVEQAGAMSGQHSD